MEYLGLEKLLLDEVVSDSGDVEVDKTLYTTCANKEKRAMKQKRCVEMKERISNEPETNSSRKMATINVKEIPLLFVRAR